MIFLNDTRLKGIVPINFHYSTIGNDYYSTIAPKNYGITLETSCESFTPLPAVCSANSRWLSIGVSLFVWMEGSSTST